MARVNSCPSRANSWHQCAGLGSRWGLARLCFSRSLMPRRNRLPRLSRFSKGGSRCCGPVRGLAVSSTTFRWRCDCQKRRCGLHRPPSKTREGGVASCTSAAEAGLHFLGPLRHESTRALPGRGGPSGSWFGVDRSRPTSVAEAGLHFLGLYGTSQLVPFPSVADWRIPVGRHAYLSG